MEGKCCAEKSANSCSTEKTDSCGDKTGTCGTGGCSSGGCGGKSKCCPGTVIKGAILGGIIMFVWFSLSWRFFPWHAAALGANIHVEPAILGEYFVFCLVVAALLTKILKKRSSGCCPVAGSIIVSLLVALFNYVPAVIWQHAPTHDALVGMADDIIAITLAGAAIGKFVLKAGACTMGKCGDAGKCGDGKENKDIGGCCSGDKTSCH